MQLLMSGLGVLIMVGVCGLGTFFIVAEQQRGHGATAAPKQPAGTPTALGPAVDTRPLSLAEVFPGPDIRPVPGAAAYGIGMTHIDTDCATAATGTLGPLLAENGCSQVVRAAITAPRSGYLVTAGVFNLRDKRSAALIGTRARRYVADGDGSFAAMGTGRPGSDPVIEPLTGVGWHTRGQFLLYCVITRPDGETIHDGDPLARSIAIDLVESYLGNTIIGRRSPAPVAR
jgi:hypothetical protein